MKLVLIFNVVVFYTASIAFATELKGALFEPCGTNSDCLPELVCSDNGLCQCQMGHLSGVCLTPTTNLQDPCHLDEQCHELLGPNSVCGEKDGKCSCPANYTSVVLDKAVNRFGTCEMNCSSSSDCEKSAAGTFCGPIANTSDVHVCQKKVEEVTSAGVSTGMIVGIIAGVVVLILLLVAGLVCYRKRASWREVRIRSQERQTY